MDSQQRQRLHQKKETLQAEWDRRNEKLKRLRQASASESDTAIKFKLEGQIQDEETHLNKLEKGLILIEQELQNSLDESLLKSGNKGSFQTNLKTQIPSPNVNNKAKKELASWQRLAIIFGMLAAVCGTIAFLYMRTSTQNFLNLLNSSDLDRISGQVSAIKQAVDSERMKVDILPENSDYQIAIADYAARKAQINNSLILHQLFLQKVSEIKEQGKLQGNMNELSLDIENSLARMIKKYRIPSLANDLQKRDFGKIIDNSQPRQPPEQQFTPGALRTTYEILITESGAHADLDGNGLIKSPDKDNPREANQIPCMTLREIEDLWKKATSQKCTWYNRQSLNTEHNNPQCEAELKRYGIYRGENTLATMFSQIYPDELSDRVKYCEKSGFWENH